MLRPCRIPALWRGGEEMSFGLTRNTRTCLRRVAFTKNARPTGTNAVNVTIRSLAPDTISIGTWTFIMRIN